MHHCIVHHVRTVVPLRLRQQRLRNDYDLWRNRNAWCSSIVITRPVGTNLGSTWA